MKNCKKKQGRLYESPRIKNTNHEDPLKKQRKISSNENEHYSSMLHAGTLSCCSHVWLCVTLFTVAHQAPLSMGFFQARMAWLSMSPSRGSSRPRDWNRISYVYLHWQEGSLPLVTPEKPTLPFYGWVTDWKPFMVFTTMLHSKQ